jgi:hypothetical protein
MEAQRRIATIMPAAVHTSALPMPPASWFTSPMPWSRMPRNIWIMPTTVPNRPSSGPGGGDGAERC